MERKNYINIIINEVEELHNVNILVVGKTGSGKTTLINELNSYILQEPNNHLNIDEIPGLELSQEKQNRVNENLYNIINKKCSSNHINKQIHFLTQSLEKINAENIKTIIEDELDFVTVVPVLAQPLEIYDVYKIKCYGLDNLYETVVEKFPYEIKNSKEDCQLINLELMKSYSSFVVSM
eukprot:jgi/Orpsp1_1/1182620/evm.model.c7180000081999.1